MAMLNSSDSPLTEEVQHQSTAQLFTDRELRIRSFGWALLLFWIIGVLYITRDFWRRDRSLMQDDGAYSSITEARREREVEEDMSSSPSTRKRAAPSSDTNERKTPKKRRWDSLSDSATAALTSDSPLSALSELKEQLICALCIDLLEEPKTLSCAHTFCDQCIQGVIDKLVGGRRATKLSCPLCRDSVAIPRDGFKTNTMIREMVAKLKGVQVPKRDEMVKCQECGKLDEKRDLFICSDESHRQGSSTGGEGEAAAVEITLCSLCVITLHRDHPTRTYVKQVSDEDRKTAKEKIDSIRCSIEGKLRTLGDSIVGELKLGIPLGLLDSIAEVIEDRERTRFWPKLEEQTAEAEALETRVDKILSHTETVVQEVAELVLSSKRSAKPQPGTQQQQQHNNDSDQTSGIFASFHIPPLASLFDENASFRRQREAALNEVLNEAFSPSYEPASPRYSPASPDYQQPWSPQYNSNLSSPAYSPSNYSPTEPISPVHSTYRQQGSGASWEREPPSPHVASTSPAQQSTSHVDRERPRTFFRHPQSSGSRGGGRGGGGFRPGQARSTNNNYYNHHQHNRGNSWNMRGSR